MRVIKKRRLAGTRLLELNLLENISAPKKSNKKIISLALGCLCCQTPLRLPIVPLNIIHFCHAQPSFKSDQSFLLLQICVPRTRGDPKERHTCTTLMSRPVSEDNCSRTWRAGLGEFLYALFRVSSCLAVMVVRGRLAPASESSGEKKQIK